MLKFNFLILGENDEIEIEIEIKTERDRDRDKKEIQIKAEIEIDIDQLMLNTVKPYMYVVVIVVGDNITLLALQLFSGSTTAVVVKRIVKAKNLFAAKFNNIINLIKYFIKEKCGKLCDTRFV